MKKTLWVSLLSHLSLHILWQFSIYNLSLCLPIILLLLQETTLVVYEKKITYSIIVSRTWCLWAAFKVRSISISLIPSRVKGAGRQVTQIKLNLTKHALNGYYLLASTFNFNKPNSWLGPLVNCCCCWGPPVTNFDYETWQLLFLSSSKLAASRNGTTPKALLIFVPHKTQPPDGQAESPLRQVAGSSFWAGECGWGVRSVGLG